MIVIDLVGLLSIFILSVLLGVVIGTKTSADRWVEYMENKNDY
jgi:hypothetical protein